MAKAKDSSESKLNAMEQRIHRNLLLFIEQSGYSQNQIADMAGIAQASFGRYIRGENAVQADVLRPLADVFGRQVGDFFEAVPPPPPVDLESRRPVFLRSRPGFELTEEDLAEFEAFMQGVRDRRAKKQKGK